MSDSKKEADVFRFPDGSAIYRANQYGKWVGHWADKTPLRGDNDERSFFATADEGIAALQAGGEGPAAKTEVVCTK